MTEPHPTIRPQPGILDIALYVGGDSRLAGTMNKVTKLSSNENLTGLVRRRLRRSRRPRLIWRFILPRITPTCGLQSDKCMGLIRRG